MWFNCHYSIEKKPLGTVGPLTLINDLPENFLVVNGDLLTDLNYKEFYKWHIKKGNDITIGTFRLNTKIPSGILKYDDKWNVIEFKEKPIEKHFISMGIYALNRKLIKSLPKNEPYGFDQLITDALEKDLKIKAYLHKSFWFDIGRDEDYKKANEYYQNNHNFFNV